MSGIFSNGESSLYVSNKRFCALIEWAIEVADQVNHPLYLQYIDKMRTSYEDYYAPVSSLNFREDLSKEEQIFWSKVFQVVAHKIFGMELGNKETKKWRPSAIADAMRISEMLQDLSGEYLPFEQCSFK